MADDIYDIKMTAPPQIEFGVVARAYCLEIAQEVAEYSRDFAPKPPGGTRDHPRTGLLAAGFRAVPDGDGAAVVNPVRYWKYVEFGTSSHERQPHVRPAVDLVRSLHT